MKRATMAFIMLLIGVSPAVHHLHLAYAAAPSTLSGSPALHGCGFRRAAWHVVKVTAISAKYADGYSSTDDVENDKAPLDEQLDRALARYGYPPGSGALQTAYDHVWSHLWNEAYWQSHAWDDLSNDSMYTYEMGKAKEEALAAKSAMPFLWLALKGTC